MQQQSLSQRGTFFPEKDVRKGVLHHPAWSRCKAKTSKALSTPLGNKINGTGFDGKKGETPGDGS